MLATAGPLPVGQDWQYEFKWDGIRVIAELTGAGTRLYARSGAEVTVAYPELARLGEELASAISAPLDAVLDGEIVVFDQAGRPSFEALAERIHVREAARAARLAASAPVTLLIFDLLRWDGVDVTHWPYAERRQALEALRLDAARWLVPPTFSDGAATLQTSEESGLEGVVAKRLHSVYRPGLRSADWVKVKTVRTLDAVVGGWRRGQRPLGALLVGAPRPDGLLTYQGRVGGGLTDRMIRQLLELLRPLAVDRCPFAEPPPRQDAQGAVWVRPELVVEVGYGNITPAGRLRFPRFLRIRPDLAVADVGSDARDEGFSGEPGTGEAE